MSNLFSLLPPAAGSAHLVLDGGFSTELERTHCYDLSGSRLWSAALLKDDKGCESIKSVHTHFLKAGADVITTSSYQATVEGFVFCGSTEAEAEELLCRSVQLACDARDEYRSSTPVGRQPPYVAISLGCYGAFLADGSEFTGVYPAKADEEFLFEFHRARLDVYRRGGALDRADVLAYETFPCAREARAVARLMREEAASGRTKPFWVSFSAKDGGRCSSGDPVAECFEPFITTSRGVVPGLLALGFNCTSPCFFTPLLRTAADCLISHSAAGQVTLIAYPNLGEEWVSATKQWKEETGLNDQSFGPTVAGWVSELEGAVKGVKIGLVGGCCRTTPEMITNLKANLKTSVGVVNGN